jgi:hypothetical protein
MALTEWQGQSTTASLLLTIAGANLIADSDRRRHLTRLREGGKARTVADSRRSVVAHPELGWRSGALRPRRSERWPGKQCTTITKSAREHKPIVRKVARAIMRTGETRT